MPPDSPILTGHRGDMTIFKVEIGSVTVDQNPTVVTETDRIAFEVSPREAGMEYEIRIGDFAIERAHHGRRAVEWEDNAYFDSARGQTQITLLSRNGDDPAAAWATRARFDLWVCPGKLTETAYQRMFDDLAKLSGGLVFDLLAKSSTGLGKHMKKP